MAPLKQHLRKKAIEVSNFLMLKSTIEKEISSFDISQLEFYQNELQELSIKLQNIYGTIFDVIQEADLDATVNEFQELKQKVNILKVSLLRTERRFKEQTSEICSRESTKASNLLHEIRLPTLELPVFTGSIEQWISFRDLFRASVHCNRQLSDAQKLQYLKSAVKGDALKIIQSISLTDANYKVAWDLLSERFSNTRELVFCHIRKLMCQPTLQTESAPAILNLVDVTSECVRSLEVLDQRIENFSDTLVLFTVQQKLDSSTRTWWERSLKDDRVPLLKDLLDFLRGHARSLNASRESATPRKAQERLTAFNASISFCKMCNQNHKIHKCGEFLKLSPNKRFQFVKNKKLCFNCLNSSHSLNQCKTTVLCKTCGKKHHTLIHFRSTVENATSPIRLDQDLASTQCSVEGETSGLDSKSCNAPSLPPVSSYSCVFKSERHSECKQTLLATAIVKVRDSNGFFQNCRALVDPGSQANFITDSCVQKLGLPRTRANVDISCLGKTALGTSEGEVNLVFTPGFKETPTFIERAYVLRKISDCLPNYCCDTKNYSHLKNLQLADPTFHHPGTIDILLGVTAALPLFTGQTLYGCGDMPFAVSSELGWLIGGPAIVQSTISRRGILVNFVQSDIDGLLKKFYDLEAVPTANMISKEEKRCEQHFLSTHTRDESGRFVVRLPFKSSPCQLGDSRERAVRRFKTLERRLSKHPSFEQYKVFMTEYQENNHMEIVPDSEVFKSSSSCFYMPHHPVFKDSSTTTKLRVVFDASAKSTHNTSLNDILMVGPRCQQDLVTILLKFRMHQIAVTADITKMFRQIRMHPEDADFQRIVWRDDPSMPIRDFRLTTVTYGTASAPYLATRAIRQLAVEERDRFPLASRRALQDFYVDDLLSGADTQDEACKLSLELLAMMKSGGFELRKWASNNPEVLKHIPSELIEIHLPMEIAFDQSIKVLGVNWQPFIDMFSVSVQDCYQPVATKRAILSDVARIFDPLGWLSPVVILAKILLQELWKTNRSWDDPISENIQHKWFKFRSELHQLKSVQIPRCAVLSCSLKIQLHLFCDASEKGYCAVAFLRSVTSDSDVKVSLLMSKTKVAPLKTISLPRLELCAALLLVRLFETVQEAIAGKFNEIYAWTDSTVVLSWLASEPHRWQTFVANRVSEIQGILPFRHWYHVQGKENPADCGSRGFYPSDLPSCNLWWVGPHWLSDPNFEVPMRTEIDTTTDSALCEEKKKIVSAVACLQKELSLISKSSSLMKLYRVLAWCFRFISNCRIPIEQRKLDLLSTEELRRSIICVVKNVQTASFPKDIHALQENKPLPDKSKLMLLNPFLDSDGVIRVGGRLNNANLPENRLHPMILPKKHHFTDLVVKYNHIVHLHAGPQLLQSILRQKFWILCGRDVVRRTVKECMTCFRLCAKSASQLMADLPASRVTPSRAFLKVGVDYAGPFYVKASKGRGHKSLKCYTALFVCFSTRAIHLELVSDLSTKMFLAALRRFVGRRGKPAEIFSDCATNFVGANKELKELLRFVASCKTNEEFNNFVLSEGLKWNFNPPASPHFGGLWEAGVKSMKFHMKRVIGDTLLTYEEFSTLLIQIEACLNSRPLCPLSEDPSDLTALTPGHFLIGGPLTALPEPSLTDLKLNHLDRWQFLQRLFQHFWKRWSNEYLSRLQQRPKWARPKPNLKIGDLVLIKNELLSPLRWKLGRISAIFPGSDGKVRVVNVLTSSGELKRSITKVCPLPLDCD